MENIQHQVLLHMNPKIDVRVKKLALTMNPKSDVKTALTPGRTSAWHHSPWERGKRFPRLYDIKALDLRWFRVSM
jgi:hypothetical protein